MITYTDSIPLSDYQRLRAAAGWRSLPDKEAADGLAHTFCSVCCMDDGIVVGMLRLMWDRGYSAYISDVIVDERYRMRGIASTMINMAKERLIAAAGEGYNIKLFLLAAKNRESFYERFGFEVRPSEKLGAAMDMWIELPPGPSAPPGAEIKKADAAGCEGLVFKKAGPGDLDLLVETRAEVLRAANKLDPSADMTEVMKTSRQYYIDAFAGDTHTAYLVFDGDEFVGAGGISYYKVMPTYHNPSGRKAYVMNMYVRPGYRRRGIAYRTLDLLVKDAESRGVDMISLEATDMGKPLYKKYGFVFMNDEMELPRQ